MKKVYVSETEGPRRRGRPVVRWKDRVKEYMHERVADRVEGIEQARECLDKEVEALLSWPSLLGTFSEEMSLDGNFMPQVTFVT